MSRIDLAAEYEQDAPRRKRDELRPIRRTPRRCPECRMLGTHDYDCPERED